MIGEREVAVVAVVELTGGVVAVTVDTYREVSKCGGMVIGGDGKLGTKNDILPDIGCLTEGL